MNSFLSHSLIAISAGLIGALSSAWFDDESKDTAPITHAQKTLKQSENDKARWPDDSQWKIQHLQQQVDTLENKLAKLTGQPSAISTDIKSETLSSITSVNRENIINSGINATTVDEILFRIDQQNNRRLELQSLIQTSDVSKRREYSKELRELLNNKITLRSEIGDDLFDQYLFLNRQFNRVKVNSIKPGSPAESEGILPNDIIIYYDNKKILNSIDIKSASRITDISSNTIIEINRDGEEISFTVPGGNLGIKFEPILIDPYFSH